MASVSIFRQTVTRKKADGTKHRKKCGNWIMRWTDPVTGERPTENTGTRVKEHARKIKRAKEQELDLAPHGLHDPTIKHANMAWGEARDKFLGHCRATKRAQTAEAYGYGLSAFERLAKPNFLRDVTVGLLSEFTGLRREEVVEVTVNKDLRSLRAMLNWAEEMHYLRQAPRFKGLLLREDVKQPVVIREFDKIIAVLDAGTVTLTMRSAGWWRVFLRLAYETGCRRGEIMGMAWKFVFLDRAEITIPPETSKGRHEKPVFLTQEMVKLLADWREQSQPINPDDPVLPWPYSTYKQLYVDLDRIRKAAGVKFVPKNLRSTCGTEHAEGGANLAVIRDILGHSTIATTAKYYTNTTEAMRQAVELRRARKAGGEGV